MMGIIFDYNTLTYKLVALFLARIQILNICDGSDVPSQLILLSVKVVFGDG